MMRSPHNQQNSYPQLQVMWLQPSNFWTPWPQRAHLMTLFSLNHFLFFLYARLFLFFSRSSFRLRCFLHEMPGCHLREHSKQNSVLHELQVSFGKSGWEGSPTTPLLHLRFGHHLQFGSRRSWAKNLNCWYWVNSIDVTSLRMLSSSISVPQPGHLIDSTAPSFIRSLTYSDMHWVGSTNTC